MTTKAEKCRLIAEWLEPHPKPEFVVSRSEVNADAQHPLKAWRYEFMDSSRQWQKCAIIG